MAPTSYSNPSTSNPRSCGKLRNSMPRIALDPSQQTASYPPIINNRGAGNNSPNVENSNERCLKSLDGTGRHVWAAATTEIVEYSANGTRVAIPRLVRYCCGCHLQDILS